MIGVDVSPESVADARRNAAINRITKADFRAGAIEDILEEVVRTAQFNDILAVIGERFFFWCKLWAFFDACPLVGTTYLEVVLYNKVP